MLSVAISKIFFCCLKLLTLIVQFLHGDRFAGRENMLVAEDMKKSVLGSTFLSACNVKDWFSKNFHENGVVREGSDYIKLGQLGTKDMNSVLRSELSCNESGECTPVG